tara:strand:- start:141 stop:884 length:744 start_codon:yes stop_codon:yes gene_type:complete
LNFLSLFKRKLLYKIKKKISIDNDEFNSESLDALFHYYGSDKADIYKFSKTQGHGFSKFYIEKLQHLREKKINILEIGSFAGASAASFIKYFKNSEVFCFDINISKFKFSSKRIQVFGLDIKNEKNVYKTLKYIFEKKDFKEFDLIIDDGSHNLSDIFLGLKIFLKHLKSNGFYIIEDYKHPNYYKYNKDIDEILIDTLLEKISKKSTFKSKIFNESLQTDLFNSIDEVVTFKGNLKDSDICFLKKK